MAKKAVSLTLTAENLVWLRGQARVAGARSLSEMVDRVVSRARTGDLVHETGIRSVRGIIRIAEDDPGLERGDEAIRALFDPARRRQALARLRRRPTRLSR